MENVSPNWYAVPSAVFLLNPQEVGGTNVTGSPGYPNFGAFAWYEFLEGGSKAGQVKVYSFTGTNTGTCACRRTSGRSYTCTG